MILKVLITLFEKMIWFIGVWTTVHDMLPIKYQKFYKILQLQTLIYLKQYVTHPSQIPTFFRLQLMDYVLEKYVTTTKKHIFPSWLISFYNFTL